MLENSKEELEILSPVNKENKTPFANKAKVLEQRIGMYINQGSTLLYSRVEP